MSSKTMVESRLIEARRLAEARAAIIMKTAPPLAPRTENGGTASTSENSSQQNVTVQPHKNDNPKINLTQYGLRPLYSKVNIDSDKWLLTMDEEARAKLEDTPSHQDGVSREMEEDIRYLGCELIQAGAILLKLPQTAAATGQILFQRFYYLKSFAKVHFEHIVMACLLLASKIEEAWRRPRDVINVFHRLEKLHRIRQAGCRITKERTASLKPNLLDESYVKLRHQVIKAERRLLATLGFVVHVRHPHKLIFSYAMVLQVVDNHELMQKAWSYMNDGLRSDMFVRYSAETIACACIFLAARTVTPKVKLPDAPFAWFELFDASDRDVQHISLMLLKLYQRKRAPNWSAINKHLDLLRFGKDGAPAEGDSVVAAADNNGRDKPINKKMEHLRVNGRDDRESSAEERENRRDSRDGRRGRERERERDASRSRSRSSKSRSRSRDRRRDRRRRTPERDRGSYKDNKDRHRDRGGIGRSGKKEKGSRDWRDRSRSRDRIDRNDRIERKEDTRERAKVRENEVRSALKRRRDSPSPPNRYRK